MSVGRSVGRSVVRFVSFSVCSHVFSRTVDAVDTKRGYVGMCNGRSAQQESGVALSKNSMWGPKIIYSYYTRCALIRDRQPTAWEGKSNVYLESMSSDSSRKVCKCQERGSFCERG